MTQARTVVIAGAGPGNGVALAQRFAKENRRVALLARNEERVKSLAAGVDGAQGFACDVSDTRAVSAAFTAIAAALGPVETLIYNAGSGVFADVEHITPQQFEDAWRVNALGALLCAREVIPAMKAKGAGNIVFIGATASRRGGKNSAAFAPAKAAQRSLAESMARSLWPVGIHVAIIIIDGVVDEERTRHALPDKPNDFFVDPHGVAETVWNLTQQERRAWSFEVEVRPFREAW